MYSYLNTFPTILMYSSYKRYQLVLNKKSLSHLHVTQQKESTGHKKQ